MITLIKRKSALEMGIIFIILLSAVFLLFCNEEQEAGVFYLEPGEFSEDADELMGIINKNKEWIYRYKASEEREIFLTASHYEKGVRPISHVPTFQGKIKGEGLLVIDYKEGELLMGISSDDGHQSIQTTLEDPEAQGSVYHSLDQRISLEPGKYIVGSIVMSKDGRIESRGLITEEDIVQGLNNHDYVFVFSMEVHP